MHRAAHRTGPVGERLMLAAAGVGEALLRRTGRRTGAVLVYHRLAEQPGDPSRRRPGTISPRALEAQLRHLSRRFRVVPASQLLEAARSRRPGERFPVAVTFDDDLASHVRHALPALGRAGLPAAFFLCGASLDRPHRFWWERLEAAVARNAPLGPAFPGGPPAPLPGVPGLHLVADAVERMEPSARERFSAALEDLTGSDPPGCGLDAAGVGRLARAGHEIGFHTLRHHPLTGLGDEELAEALREGRGALEEAAGMPLAGIAYPHGRADRRVAEAARRGGLTRGFTCAGRPMGVSSRSDPLLVGRFEVHTGSVARMALRLLGALVLGAHTWSPRRRRLAARVPPRLMRPLRRLATWPPLGPGRAGLGSRRRPVSRQYGFDRGNPVDRHYIARFLEAHGADIRGRVLEVGSDDYTRRYGGAAVSGVEVLDVSPRNPRATIVADLNDPQGLPAGRFDCVICTQTLLLVYDVRAAVGTLHAALAAGGVLLVTVPGISRICQPEGDLWGDYWRFTSASLRRLLEERFGPSGVAVEAFGNVLAATAALHGLAAEELGDRKLALRDPDYEVIVAARARKA